MLSSTDIPYPSLATIAISVVILSVFYLLALSICSLYFSPIVHFPGPKTAALTLWYEFYFDGILQGRYTWEIKRMHDRYGPIVRITPYELHIDDPDFYNEINPAASVRKVEKYGPSARAFGGDFAAFGTVPHAHHRMRRAALNPFFSKKSVAELMPVIQSGINGLCERLREFRATGAPANIINAYSAMTVDVITDYAFATSMGNLDTPDFVPSWHATMMKLSELYHPGKQFHWVITLQAVLPEWVIKATNPGMMVFPNLQNVSPLNSPKETLLTSPFLQMLRKEIEEVRSGDEEFYKTVGHRTKFHELIFNSELPPEELTTRRLIDEGISVVTAGRITVAHFLSMTTFQLLRNPTKLATLRDELSNATAESKKPLTLQQLEQLLSLGAVINEGFRMSYGVMHRLTRVSPDSTITYKEWTIPRGTPVGMSSIWIHDNPILFPSPRTFIPERWLSEEAKKQTPG